MLGESLEKPHLALLLLGLLDSVRGASTSGLLAAAAQRPPPSTPAVGPVRPTQRWETSPEKTRGLLEAELGLSPAVPRHPGVGVPCSDKGKTEVTAAEARASSQVWTCPGSGPFPTRFAETLKHSFLAHQRGRPSTCCLPCPPRRSTFACRPAIPSLLPSPKCLVPLSAGYPCSSPSPGHVLVPKLKVALKPCLTVHSTMHSDAAHPHPPQWGGPPASGEASIPSAC